MSDKTKAWLAAAVIALLFGLVGRMDYVEALERENTVLKVKNAQCRGVVVSLAKHFDLSETTVKTHKCNLGLTKTRRNAPKRPPKKTGYEVTRPNAYTTRVVRLG